jgi:hypothetical protein
VFNLLLHEMKLYNKILKSMTRAGEFYSNPNIPQEEKDAKDKDLDMLSKKMIQNLKNIEALGYNMSEEELSKGFRQVEALKL